VHQTGAVSGVQRGGHLCDDADGPRRVHRAPSEFGGEVAAVHQPHVEEEPPVDLAVAVDRDDMRLVETSCGLALPAEARAVGVVGGQVRGQQLQGDDTIALRGVGRPVDLAHPAAAQQRAEPVRAELFVRRGHFSPGPVR
jgi:hypothetical protein